MGSMSSHITTGLAWREWKKRCAADLCEPEIAGMLHRFGALRFASMLKRVTSDAERNSVDGSRGWHLLETYARVSSTREGKRYKDWLFARADLQGERWLALIESGASLLMREVVRHYLREESAPAFMVSLNMKIDRDIQSVSGTDGLSLEDLLPGQMDPLDEIETREWNNLARSLAGSVILSMSLIEKVAVAARAQGVPLSDPRVIKIAGCSRSQLYAAYGECVERVARALKREHPAEEAARLIQGARLVLDHLEKIIAREFSGENKPAHSFTFI